MTYLSFTITLPYIVHYGKEHTSTMHKRGCEPNERAKEAVARIRETIIMSARAGQSEYIFVPLGTTGNNWEPLVTKMYNVPYPLCL